MGRIEKTALGFGLALAIGAVVSCGSEPPGSEPPAEKTGCDAERPSCVDCESGVGHYATCSGASWVCPTGTVEESTCTSLCGGPPPSKLICDHYCGGIAQPVCVNRRWECPPRPLSCPVLCAGNAPECFDRCGSDWIRERATCNGSTWICAVGVKASDCPTSTCWGAPRTCYGCQDHQLKVLGSERCNNGSYVCDRGTVTEPRCEGTTVTIGFTFGRAADPSCTNADLSGTAGASDLVRGLRYKLSCGASELKNTTGSMAEQVTLCASSPTVLAPRAFTGSGNCTLEAQMLSAENNSWTTWEHCDFFAKSNVTVTSGQANVLSINLSDQTDTGVCPLAKQL